MNDAYINAAIEVFGANVNMIADRFHIARLYRKSVDELRISEIKRLKQELPKEDYEALGNPLWMLRETPKKLSDANKTSLKLWQKYSPKLVEAYLFSNALTDIFNAPLPPVQAKEKIMAWARLVQERELDCFTTFLGTLEYYINPITNYFENRLTSGFVEGLNNKIKVIKRRSYGIFNLDHLFQRIVIDLVGYAKFS